MLKKGEMDVSWHERMNLALDYIENNLCGNIDMEYISKITYQSVTSFQRTFSIITEMPVSEYIRRRRMSLAATELQNSRSKVVDISLKYGYDSPEAFTRAFKEIYGISPTKARKEGMLLKTFPRISFLLTIKGDVVMENGMDSGMNNGMDYSSVKITNLYHEHMPAIRFIGKRYTSADLNSDGLLMDKWNDWFQNGWFNILSSLPGLPGYEGIAHTGYHKAAEISFWIGMMFPQDTPVPEGFDKVDFPEGDMAVCWLNGYRETGELYTPAAQNLCVTRIREAGYALKLDYDGEPCKWTFERYHPRRFFMPDDEGRVTMDYCVYVVPTEQAAKTSLNNGSEQHANCGDSTAEQTSIQGEEPLRLPSPEIKISDMAPYYVDAESNLLLCAMTTMFLKLNNYTQATPFFCSRIGEFCKDCGGCGKSTNLAKHHLDYYHYLVTVTGVGLMWSDPNEAGDYDLKHIQEITPPLLEDRLDFAMKAEGFKYNKLDKSKGELEILRRITESIRKDKPVLIKLGYGPEWYVVTGFDKKTSTLFGLDARDNYSRQSVEKRSYTEDGLFIITDWFKNFHKAIIVTEKSAKTMNFSHLLQRMTGQLLMPERSVLESMIPRMIDSITVENARGVAEYLNGITGRAAETRWHGAECFGGRLLRKTEDEKTRALLRECRGFCFDTHDTCFQIWGQLGVGPHTLFRLPTRISQMMLEKERQEKLKELFARIFLNDSIVLEKLQCIGLEEKANN